MIGFRVRSIIYESTINRMRKQFGIVSGDKCIGLIANFIEVG